MWVAPCQQDGQCRQRCEGKDIWRLERFRLQSVSCRPARFPTLSMRRKAVLGANFAAGRRYKCNTANLTSDQSRRLLNDRGNNESGAQ